VKRIRTLIWFLTTTVLIFSFADIGLAFQNEPDGFRGLKWGDPPTEDMVCVDILEGELRLYKCLNDKLHIGDAWFHKIVYSFFGWPGRLMGVSLHFYGERNYKLLENICQGRFGKEITKQFYKHFWMGQQANVLLTYDVAKDEGALALTNSMILSEYTKAVEAEKKRRAEETQEDW